MDYEKYFSHYKEIESLKESRNFESSKIKIVGATYNDLTKFKRIGINHDTLPPGCRTSFPHSEKTEEELIFVIEGTPDLWVDGYIYPMKPLDVAGFPAGTGINHTVINNSGKDVRLLVLGERTRDDNQCYFPLNPERKKEMGDFWWENAPKNKLGPHNGLPKKVSQEELGKTRPSFLKNASELEVNSGFSYPGDSETFSNYVKYGDAIGLKKIAISYETLQPGKRSSWPHAHTHEEEFAFVLSGKLKVWLNGFIFELLPGTGIAFPPNTNIAHCLINDSKEPATFFMVGEPGEIKGEKILYPLHPKRNEELRLKNYLWTDAPKFELGPHNGKP